MKKNVKKNFYDKICMKKRPKNHDKMSELITFY